MRSGPFHESPSWAAIATGLALMMPIRVAPAAPSCPASCVARMSACRAERCPAATGKDRRHCRDVCRAVTGCAAGAARIRGTIATVVTECHVAGGKWTARQRLEIRRGDCPPVTVMTIEGDEPLGDLGLCKIYGDQRSGGGAMAVGAFQGVAVSPDGETVLFQLTNDFIGRIVVRGITDPIPTPSFTLSEEGFFVVRSDGSDLHRIAPQSREAPFVIRPGPGFPGIRVIIGTPTLSFSPDGRLVAFVDRGPGSDGSVAPQVFTLDPRTGARRQLTSFTASSVADDNPNGTAVGIFFYAPDRIGVSVYDSLARENRTFIMRADGSDVEPVNPLPGPPGSHVIPNFAVTGSPTEIGTLELDRSTDLPQPGLVNEIFVKEGTGLLQLTNFDRSDTEFTIPLRDRVHIVLGASADPLHENPWNTCQLFSIDRLGGHLRQLTHFDPGATAPGGCAGGGAPPGCTILFDVGIQDKSTGAMVFDSNCDPFGVNAVSQQLFALRSNGTGFRQLTAYRGTTTGPGGTVDVELPGPISYQRSR
jgi:hypothetical protein